MTFMPVRAVLREVGMTLREPFRISSGVTNTRRVLLVELIDAEGHSGWGECVAGEMPNYSSETVETARLAITRWLAPRVLGTRFDSAARVAARWDGTVRGHRMAKAALEMAAWALEAEVRQVSLASLLGGTQHRVPVGISLGLQDTIDAIVERAVAARALGYRRIKIKIAPGHDEPWIAAVRAALGPDIPLSVDANAAYRIEDADDLAALDRYNLVMIEQPLAGDDLIRHARLQARLQTPICLDESISHGGACADALELGACRIVNIKPGRVGGLAEAIRIHDLCAAERVPVWCGGMLETGIGRAHNVALASLPNFHLPNDLSPSARYWTEDIVDPEWTMSADGWVTVPRDVPGLGVAVRRDLIADRTAWEETLTA